MKEQYMTHANANTKVKKWKRMIAKYQKHNKTGDIQKSALLVIDMQNYFGNRASHAYIPSIPSIIKNIKRLIDLFRKHNAPIFFIRFAVKKNKKTPMMNWWKDCVYEGTEESEILSDLKRKDTDNILQKSTYSSFYGTTLKKKLQQKKRNQLIITGVHTNLCCETTAREAFIQGFEVFVVMDATAAYNEAMHIASLTNLAYGFATILPTKEIIKCKILRRRRAKKKQ